MAGLLLGLTAALRPQIAPALLVIIAWPGIRIRWHLAAGAAAALLAASLLDWITLGAPSASIWRYFLVNIRGASSSFGTQPWYYYFLAEAAIWGVTLPVPVALSLIGARRWAMPIMAAIAILAAHVAIAHKEHRFIYPARALGAVSAGIGMSAVAAWLSARLGTWSAEGPARRLTGRQAQRVASILCILPWTAICALAWTGPAMTMLRTRVADNLAAADYTASLPGICGIGMGPGQDAWVPYGGYSHLHQAVPLFWPR
jgi:phosphatidylinositol glycan class B